jgi:hypothetical protein
LRSRLRVVAVLAAIALSACFADSAPQIRPARTIQRSVAGTLVIALVADDGIALGTDGRATVELEDVVLHYDDNPKLFNFAAPHNFVGVMTHGTAAVGMTALTRSQVALRLLDEVRQHGADSPTAVQLRSRYRSEVLTWDRFMPAFVATLPSRRFTVAEYADRLKAFLDRVWQTYPNLPGTQFPGFIVAGYDPDSAARVYHFNVGNSEPKVLHTDSAIGGDSAVIAKRLIRGSEEPGHTDDDIRRRFAKLSAADLKEIIDRIQREELNRQNHRPSHSVQATAGLIRYVIETTMEIQNSLSAPNAFRLGGRPDVATITPARGFQR